MDENSALSVTISDYISRLSRELNIEGTKGLFGNEIELIALVRNCQFLYDKSLADFKNIQKKNEAWEAIANVFGVSVGEVQQRWKGMRDLFNKYRNKSDIEIIGNTGCPYYEYMKFLEPYIVGRRNRLSGLNATLSDQVTSDEENSKGKESYPSFDDLKQFIEKIKTYPLLYHHKYSGGTHGKQKVDAWIEIAKFFGVPVKECLARWRTLRERYSRERRLQISGEAVKKWELFDYLSFLDQHVKTRRRYKYTRIVPINSSSNDPNVCYVVTSPSSSVTLDTSFLNMSTSKKDVTVDDVEFFDVSRDVSSSPAAMFNDDNNLSEISINETNGQRESSQVSNSDEDDIFGQSIAAELKKLTCPRKKMKLKAEIFRLLYEHTCS